MNLVQEEFFFLPRVPAPLTERQVCWTLGFDDREAGILVSLGLLPPLSDRLET